MRMLGFVGSPRNRGNTFDMVDAVLEGGRENGADTALFSLGKMNISECIGCHRCWTGTDCVRTDDMLPLYREIEKSDVFVFGSPVYWYGPTAIMKAFLDRFVYFNCPENRVRIKGKRAALVTPFEEEHEETAAPLVDMFERSFNYLELHYLGSVLAPGAGAKGDVRSNEDILEQCRLLGFKLSAAARTRISHL